MTIFILVSILLVAALAIALLMGVSPASQKVKVRTMYVGAALMLVVALIVCDYIDALPDFPSKFRFHAVLVLTVAVFPAGEASVSKKMPGLDKVKERREKENKSK